MNEHRRTAPHGDDRLPATVRPEQAVSVALDAQLTDLDAAWRLCTALAGSSLVPASLRGNPANVLLVVMTGQELGLSVAQSLRSIYVPKSGTPQLRGHLLLAKIREAGHDYEYELDDNGCEFTLIRGDTGRKYKAKFTVEHAITAGLVIEQPNGSLVARSSEGKPLPWELYREDLLFWRAVQRAVNRAAPEVMMGFEIMGHGSAAADPVVLEPARPAPTAQDAADTGRPAREELARLSELGEGTPANAGGPYAETWPAEATPPGDAPPQTASEAAKTETGGAPPAGPTSNPAGGAPTQAARGSAPATAAASEQVPAGPMAGKTRREAADATKAERRRGLKAVGAGREVAKLLEAFTRCGWEPRKYRLDVIRACSAFARRKVTDPQQLTPQEASELTADLVKLAAKPEPSVVLADAAEAWRQAWEDGAPDSYEAGLW